MKLIQSVLWKIYKNVLPVVGKNRASNALDAIDPNIQKGIAEIVQRANLTMSHMPYQGLDIVETLSKFKPQHIIELGSGQSSAIFAGYAKKAGATFASFEQDPNWRDLSNAGSEIASGEKPVVYTETRETPTGARYEMDIPPETDFVYMDGPYIEKKYPDNRFGKGIYADVPDFLDAGGRPKVIMCEGRIDTVDAISKHPVIVEEYRFSPSFYYALYGGDLKESFALRRHAFFVRS